LGVGINFAISLWDPAFAPRLLSSIWVFIGMGLLAGICLTPLFLSVNPKAVFVRGAVLGASLGAFLATLPLALGADWPDVGSNDFHFPMAKPFFRFVFMAMHGTVGGIIVGLIAWPKLKCSRVNRSDS